MHDVSSTGRAGSLLGHAVKRREDPALLRGERTYIGDMRRPGMLHAVFVRSPIAHGRIVEIDVAAVPNGARVFTGADFDLQLTPPPFVDQRFTRTVPARERVRFVGDIVAVVVADSEAAAVDAADLVWVDYEPLAPVVDVEHATDPAMPILFEEAGSNQVWTGGHNLDLDPLEGAEVVIEHRFVQQRLAPLTMEPGAILAEPDGTGGLTIQMGTQDPANARRNLAKALDMEPDHLRVIVPAMGGGFGAKGGVYAQHAVVCELARRLARPVRWMETRSENMVNMVHGRAQVQHARLGATRDGRVVGIDIFYLNDCGAYPTIAAVLGRYGIQMASSVYDIPAIRVRAESRVTTLTPAGPYRGAGRPEAIQLLERLMDMLALELGMDKVEIRRKNLLSPFDGPRQVASGATYDSGNYPAALEAALERAGYDELIAARDARRAAGDRMQLGVGVSTYIETTVGIAPPREYGGVRLESDGRLSVSVGGSSHGQGHDTTFAQLVAGIFDVPMDQVQVIQSDTRLVPDGVAGTYASRTLQLVGSAVLLSAEKIIDTAKEIAQDLLEVAAGDLTVGSGGLQVVGVPGSSVSWAAIAGAAAERGIELAEEQLFESELNTYPFGAHIAVVEVDMETGWARLVRHVAVDDCGTVINPMLALGQQHGGVSQGVGQALLETVRYDADGNPLTTNLTSYLIPTAVDLPSIEASRTTTPTPINPLGAKGIGEAGTLGSTPAVHSAVLDALEPLGVRHIDMPLTPARIWDAISAAG